MPDLLLLQRCDAFLRHILTTPGMEPDTIEAAEGLENDLIDAIQKILRGRSPTDEESDDDSAL